MFFFTFIDGLTFNINSDQYLNLMDQHKLFIQGALKKYGASGKARESRKQVVCKATGKGGGKGACLVTSNNISSLLQILIQIQMSGNF